MSCSIDTAMVPKAGIHKKVLLNSIIFQLKGRFKEYICLYKQVELSLSLVLLWTTQDHCILLLTIMNHATWEGRHDRDSKPCIMLQKLIRCSQKVYKNISTKCDYIQSQCLIFEVFIQNCFDLDGGWWVSFLLFFVTIQGTILQTSSLSLCLSLPVWHRLSFMG